MGDARRSENLKATQLTHDPVHAKRTRGSAVDDEEREADDGENVHAYTAARPSTQARGAVDEDGPEHQFAGVGDQDVLWREIDDVLAGRRPPNGLPAQVAKLERWRREELKSRIDEVANVAPAADVLQIADLVLLTTSAKIRAALTAKPPASARQLRAHLVTLSPADVVTELDAAALNALSAAFADPSVVVPQIAELSPAVVKSAPLVKWWLSGTPPATAAAAIARAPVNSIELLGKTLNAIGRAGWTWAFHVDDNIAAIGESAIASLAAATTEEDVRVFLGARKPAGGNGEKPGKAPGGGKAITDRVPARGVDIAEVTGAIREAKQYESHEARAVTKSPYRERLIAAATFDELVVLTETLFLYPDEQLTWYLESPHVTVERLRAATSLWGEAAVDVALTPRNTSRLLAKFPAASPADVFGAQRNAIFERATKDAQIRRWCVRNAEPRDLLALVTHTPSETARMWRVLAAEGVRPDWVQKLGTGADDKKLRVLALNCPDPAVVSWIRERLLGDQLAETSAIKTPAPIDPVANESTLARLERALEAGTSANELGRRVSELTAEEASKVRANPTQLAQVITSLDDEWLVRGLFRIEPSLAAVLRHANLDTPGLPAYIRSRPDQETVDALFDDAVRDRARLRIRAPFTLLPALRKPEVLVRVIDRPEVLAWLLDTTETGFALLQLGHPAVAARTAARFESEHLAFFASELALSTEENAALERIATALRDTDLADSLRARYVDAEAEYEEEEEEDDDEAPEPATAAGSTNAVQERRDVLEVALQHGDLYGALGVVLRNPVEVQNVLAVCRQRASDAVTFLTRPAYGPRIDALRRAVKTSPIAVFPDVPFYAYLHTREARVWLFEHEPGPALLREIAADTSLVGIVAKLFDADDRTLSEWTGRLPTGSTLTTQEQKAIRTIFDRVKTDVAARAVFKMRFGSRANDSYTRAELARLWDLLERVPDAHIEQGSVTSFYEFEPSGGVTGLYGSKSISLEEGLLRGDREHHTHDQQLELTFEQITSAYGLDRAQLDARIARGEITAIETEQGTRYRINPTVVNTIENTVLHEIGHAVDDMLGSRTELVYGLAGWKEYGEADFDRWAADLGGWNRVTPHDQRQIRDAWLVWLNSTSGSMSTGLDAFVGPEHPALAEKYVGVGVVDLARQKKPLELRETAPQAGAYSIANHRYARLYRVPERTANSAPSAYAMTAPAEYFAECYAEYYREYKGPIAGAAQNKKGGRLAGWIKDWFDQNIDKLAFNPQRR